MSAQLIVRVADCRGAYDTLSARGAKFLTEPARWDHGEVRASFRDPDGHLFGSQKSIVRVLLRLCKLR